MNQPQRLSVAIPVFNEEHVLPELLVRVRNVLDQLPGGPHEIVFVDDGSSDGTPALLAAAAATDDRIVVVTLTRNFGHQAALAAALDHVRGELVMILDGDLQDPPELIPTFLARQREGYDVVYAQRIRRKEGWLLRLCYWLFYRLIARLSDIALPVDAGDCALLTRRVVDTIRAMPERSRYLRGLRTWVGFRQIGLPVERAARAAGVSKYRWLSLLQLAFDGLFSFSTVPLRAAAVVGFFAVTGSLVFAAYALVIWLRYGSPAGFTAIILMVTFLSGVQLLSLGVIGEYLGRVYDESKGRPQYIVGSRLGRFTDESNVRIAVSHPVPDALVVASPRATYPRRA